MRMANISFMKCCNKEQAELKEEGGDEKYLQRMFVIVVMLTLVASCLAEDHRGLSFYSE